ncbi:MAG: tetratricopeptide repeat protein [Elusimicrobia bacterium]|nr:tetratricopeptide repeat protein [Elusimicrobiota bacterium]
MRRVSTLAGLAALIVLNGCATTSILQSRAQMMFPLGPKPGNNLIIFVSGPTQDGGTSWGRFPEVHRHGTGYDTYSVAFVFDWGRFPELLKGDTGYDNYEAVFESDYPLTDLRELRFFVRDLRKKLATDWARFQSISLIGRGFGGLALKNLISTMEEDQDTESLHRISRIILIGTPEPDLGTARDLSFGRSERSLDMGIREIQEKWERFVCRRTGGLSAAVFDCKVPVSAIVGLRDPLVSPQSLLAYGPSLFTVSGRPQLMYRPIDRDSDIYRVVKFNVLGKSPDKSPADLFTVTAKERLEQGHRLVSLGEYDKARDSFQQAIALSLQTSDWSSAATTLRELGRLDLTRGATTNAIVDFKQSADVCVGGKDKLCEADSVLGLADGFRIAGDSTQAQGHYDAALQIYGKDLRGQADVMTGLAELYSAIYEHDKAINYYSKAAGLYQQAGKPVDQSFAVGGKADEERRSGDFDAALLDYDRACSGFDSKEFPIPAGACLFQQGEIKRLRGDLEGAMERYRKADALYVAAGYSKGRAHVFNQQSIILKSQGSVAAARALVEESLRLYDQAGDRVGRAAALSVLASFEQNAGQTDASARQLDEANRIFVEKDNRLGQANAALYTGSLKDDLGKYSDAEAAYNRALELYRAIRASLGEANALAARADTRRTLGRAADARQDYADARKIYDRLGTKWGIAGVLTGLGRLEWSIGASSAASADLSEARRLYSGLGDRISDIAELSQAEAELEAGSGDALLARKKYEEAAKGYAQVQSLRGRAETLIGQADLSLRQKQKAEAREGYLKALGLCRAPADYRLCQANALEGLGRLEVEDKAPTAQYPLQEAARLYDLMGLADRANRVLTLIPKDGSKP